MNTINYYITTLFLFLFIQDLNSQNITFVDLKLKQKLVNSDVIDTDLDGVYESDADLNDDDEISFSEAAAVVAIKIPLSTVESIVDLEHFSNLKLLTLNSSKDFNEFNLHEIPLLEEVIINANVSRLVLVNHPNLKKCQLSLGEEVSFIKITGNTKLEELSLQKKSSTPSIDTIIINNNILEAFALGFRPGTNNQTYLNASNNQLKLFELSDARSYNLLDLSNNQLDENSFLSRLPNALIADYSNNNFVNFTYQYQLNIEELIIADNPLESFTLNTILEPLSLKNLDFTGFTELKSIAINAEGTIQSIIGIGLPELNEVSISIDSTSTILFKDCEALSDLAIFSRGSVQLEGINSDGIKNADITTFDSLIIKNSIIGDMEFGSDFYAQIYYLENNNEMTSLDFDPPSVVGADEVDLTIINNDKLKELSALGLGIVALKVFNNPQLEDINISTFNNVSLDFEGIDSLKHLRLIGRENDLNLENFPLLKTVFLSGRSTNNFAFKNLPSLDSLSIKGTNLEGLSMQELPQLSYFSFKKGASNCSENKSHLDLRDLPKLKHVILEDICIKSLSLTNLPAVEKLVIRGVETDYDDLIIDRLPQLTEIDIYRIKFKDIRIQNVENLETINGNFMYNVRDFNILNAPSLISFKMDNSSYKNLTFNDLPSLRNIRLASTSWLRKFNASNLPSLLSVYIDDSTQDYKAEILLQELAQLRNFTLDGGSSRDSIDFSTCPNLDSLTLEFGGNLLFLGLTNGNNHLSYFDISNGDFNSINTICVDDDEEIDIINSYYAFTPDVEYILDCESTSTKTFIVGKVIISDINDYVHFPKSVYLPLSAERDGEEIVFFTQENGSYSHIIHELGSEVVIAPMADIDIFEPIDPAKVYPLIAHKAYFNQDFLLKELVSTTDLQAIVNVLAPPRPGEKITYIIEIKNNGSMPAGGILDFDYNSDVLQVVDSGDLSMVSYGLLSLDFPPINPYSNLKFNVTFLANTPTADIPLTGGEELIFNLNVISDNEDIFEDNNKIKLRQIVVNSFDPNNILCAQGGKVDDNDEIRYLHYTINFENLGTDFARNIKIANLIDTSILDLNTFQLKDFSHIVDCSIQENKVSFNFNDINLSQNVNNTGYVSYSISPKILLNPGDTVKNQADIFFDFNPAITTNEHHLILNTTVSNKNNEIDDFKIYPNPNDREFVIEGTGDKITSLMLFTIDGVFVKELKTGQNTLDVNTQRGLFIIQAINQKGTIVNKIILVK